MYVPLPLQRMFDVEALYSVHYFSFAEGYRFDGERHDFWEMVYVDRGAAIIGADERAVRLTEGQIIFHRPFEFHTIRAQGSPNLAVVSFDCRSRAMAAFEGSVRTLSLPARRLLMQLMEEATRLFGPVLDDSLLIALKPRAEDPAGLSMIRSLIEQFLITVVREGDTRGEAASPVYAVDGQYDEWAAPLIEYMRAHLDGGLRFDELARASGMGRTALKGHFKRHFHMGVMEYYRLMRIEEARRRLRDGRLNVTQTAQALGYSSVHHFSAQFKRVMGLTPTEYVKSVRAR